MPDEFADVTLSSAAREFLLAALARDGGSQPFVSLQWHSACSHIKREPDGSETLVHEPAFASFVIGDARGKIPPSRIRSVDGVPFFVDGLPLRHELSLHVVFVSGSLAAEAHAT